MSGPMTYSCADVVRKALTDLGIGTDPEVNQAWPIFAYSEPALPDDCITLYDTTGIDEGRTHPDSEKQYHEGLSVRVRAKDPSTGNPKANALAIALDRMCNVNVTMEDGSSHYRIHAVTRSAGFNSIGQDYPNGKRSLFTLNAVVAVTQL